MSGEESRPSGVAALQERVTRLRMDILKMITAAGSGHPGGSLSAVDLIAALYDDLGCVD